MDTILYLLTTLYFSQAIIIMITKAGKCNMCMYHVNTIHNNICVASRCLFTFTTRFTFTYILYIYVVINLLLQCLFVFFVFVCCMAVMLNDHFNMKINQRLT